MSSTYSNITQKPRVFVSYKWEDEEHNRWVQSFVQELERRLIEVVYDRDQQRRFLDPFFNSMAYSQKGGEIMKLVHKMDFCHVFMPIFTPDYLEGIGYPGGVPVSHSEKISWVFDEFQQSILLGQARRIETVPILRRGDPEMLPPGFHAGNTLDLRTEENYVKKLDYLAYYIHYNRAVKTVPDIAEYEDYWK